jgi:CRISPR system Cascade subunit CasE
MILARLTLKRDAGAAGYVARTLLDRAPADGAHGLIWTAFGDDHTRKRDFLYREEERGRFLTLSQEVPPDPLKLWTVEAKDYAPSLRNGLVFGFRLRAALSESAKSDRSAVEKKDRRGRRIDPVLAAHHAGLLRSETHGRDQDAVFDILAAWLARRGRYAGFEVPAGNLTQALYRTIPHPRTDPPGQAERRPPRFLGIADFEGMLTVKDEALFRTTLMQGLGRAKAFGCGLLLIRPA